MSGFALDDCVRVKGHHQDYQEALCSLDTPVSQLKIKTPGCR